MVIIVIGAADEVGNLGRRVIGDHRNRGTDRPEITDFAAEHFQHFGRRRHRQRARDFRMLRRLDLVELMITAQRDADERSEEHTSELQSLMRISYAVFCLKKKQEKQDKESKQYIN